MIGFIVGAVLFGTLLIWGGIASYKRDKALGVVASYSDLKLTPTHLLVGSARYSIGGVTARVEDSGQMSKRITATRVVATGVVALAWRKRVDDRSVFLTIEGPGVAVVREVRLDKDKNAPGLARTFAASVNSKSAALGVAREPEPAGPAPSLAGQLAQLAALHDSGALTDAEYSAAKRELLGGNGPRDEGSTERAW